MCDEVYGMFIFKSLRILNYSNRIDNFLSDFNMIFTNNFRQMYLNAKIYAMNPNVIGNA